MTIGEKIKNARKMQNMTQSELASDKLTRNMISAIENGTANPSLDTLNYIAKKLSLPTSYLVAEDDDLLYYLKKDVMSDIHNAFSEGAYQHVINKILRLPSIDNELAFILANSYFESGKEALMRGALATAEKNLTLAVDTSKKTCFNTKKIEYLSDMYLAVSKNIQAPLLEFYPENYAAAAAELVDFDFYKYLMQDTEHTYKKQNYQRHMLAKAEMRARNYTGAINIMLEIIDTVLSEDYNAYLVFGIYTDLENCYKQLLDYENAYKYSSKRISLLEGFKS